MAADAVAVLDAYEIDKAHVIGRSMGGMITQHVVLNYPERILTATLIYTTPSNSISGGPEDELPGMTDELIAANAEATRTDGGEAEQLRRQLKAQQILHGTEDPIFQEAHAKALAAEIEGADVMWMEGVGHALPEEIWDTLVSRLLAHTAK